MRLSPLDHWIARKTGTGPDGRLNPAALVGYQLARLKETLAWARSRSPFYQRQLADISPEAIARLEDVASLPFTTADDLRRHHLEMLCVTQGEVSRVVTLPTSGTTGPPKRIYFTDDDLEATLDFFHHGMSTLVEPGWKVLILLPGRTPDSVGDLLKRGLARMNVEGIVHGPAGDPLEALDTARRQGVDCLVGAPVQVLAMACCSKDMSLPLPSLKSMLLTTDYVPQAIADRIRETWPREIYEHYGMTETGLGGGVQCEARQGYHLREADLLFEVVDPADGTPLPDGETGEVVFTTLTRRGMPIIRYRTGDLSRFLPGPCPCGSRLRRLDKIRGRVNGAVSLADGQTIDLPTLDEALFAMPGVLDYTAEFRLESDRPEMLLNIRPGSGATDSLPAAIREAVADLPALRASLASVRVTVAADKTGSRAKATARMEKRTIKYQQSIQFG